MFHHSQQPLWFFKNRSQIMPPPPVLHTQWFSCHSKRRPTSLRGPRGSKGPGLGYLFDFLVTSLESSLPQLWTFLPFPLLSPTMLLPRGLCTCYSVWNALPSAIHVWLAPGLSSGFHSNGALSRSPILTTLSKISTLGTIYSPSLCLILSPWHLSPCRAVGKLMSQAPLKGWVVVFLKRCFRVSPFSRCHHSPPVSAPPQQLPWGMAASPQVRGRVGSSAPFQCLPVEALSTIPSLQNCCHHVPLSPRAPGLCKMS